jgi:hypothetical protein
MKVVCNYCFASENGTVSQLIDKGWARAVIRTPVRKTITACSQHHTELNEELKKIMENKK